LQPAHLERTLAWLTLLARLHGHAGWKITAALRPLLGQVFQRAVPVSGWEGKTFDASTTLGDSCLSPLCVFGHFACV
jgi:hypothetical protein